MKELGQYILSFLFTAFLCGILSSLVPDSGKKQWVRLLCGVILATTLIKPFSHLQGFIFETGDSVIQQEGDFLSAEGKKAAQDAMADIITKNCQAYIEDKAAELGIQITAQVTVNDETIPVPVSVTLLGAISPYARLQIESMIQNDLGIAKENIRWIQ